MRQTDITAEITPFAKYSIYQSKIEPLINELVKLCTIHKIPMYVTCCVANDETGSDFKNNGVGADVLNLNLTDDNIQKHMCIQLGFDTVYRSEEIFDFEDDATKVDMEED